VCGVLRMGVGNVLPPQRGTVTKANNRPFLPDEKVPRLRRDVGLSPRKMISIRDIVVIRGVRFRIEYRFHRSAPLSYLGLISSGVINNSVI
jgi:hypothetical protein